MESLPKDVLRHLNLHTGDLLNLSRVSKKLLNLVTRSWFALSFPKPLPFQRAPVEAKWIVDARGMIEFFTSKNLAKQIVVLDFTSITLRIASDVSFYSLLQIFDNVEKLSLANCQLQANFLLPQTDSPGGEGAFALHFSASSFWCREEGAVAPIKSIRVLNLSNVRTVSQTHLAELLKAAENLEVLLLQGMVFTQEMLPSFSSTPNFSSVWPAIENLKQLKVLDISQSSLEFSDPPAHIPLVIQTSSRTGLSLFGGGDPCIIKNGNQTIVKRSVWDLYMDRKAADSLKDVLPYVTNPNAATAGQATFLMILCASTSIQVDVIEQVLKTGKSNINAKLGHLEQESVADPFNYEFPGKAPLGVKLPHFPAFSVFRNNGSTALHVACEHNNVDAIKLLLSYNADPNIQNDDGVTPLMILSALYEDSVGLFDGAKVDLNVRDSEGRTALLYAIIFNKVQNTKLLLQKGCDQGIIELTGFDDMKFQPVLLAVALGHFDLAKGLLEFEDCVSDLILHAWVFASLKDNASDFLECLAQKTFDRAFVDPSSGNTALSYAIKQKPVATTESLIALDFHTPVKDIRDQEGRTPVHWALQRDFFVVEKLVEVGFETDIKSESMNETPLLFACKGKSMYMCENVNKFLKLPGVVATVNEPDANGLTPLHAMAMQGSVDGVRILLEAGADPDAQDHAGLDPLSLHCLSVFSRDVYALLRPRTKVKPDRQFGRTFFHFLMFCGKDSVISELLESEYQPEVFADTDHCGNSPFLLACSMGLCKSVRVMLSKSPGLAVLTNKLNVHPASAAFLTRSSLRHFPERITHFQLVLDPMIRVVNEPYENFTFLAPSYHKDTVAEAKPLLLNETDTIGNILSQLVSHDPECFSRADLLWNLTLLHFLAMDAFDLTLNDSVGDLEKLLKNAKFEKDSKFGRTPLHFLAIGARGAVTIFGDRTWDKFGQWIEYSKAHFNVQDNEGMTALHHACKTSVKCATYFLCAEANVLLKDCRGDTALHTGLKWLKEERLVPLIEKFVQLDSKLVDEPNNEGETCLSLAVVRGNNLEALQKLATKKSVNLQRKKDQRSAAHLFALHWVVCADDVQALLKIHEDIDFELKDCFGKTPLDYLGNLRDFAVSQKAASSMPVPLLLRSRDVGAIVSGVRSGAVQAAMLFDNGSTPNFEEPKQNKQKSNNSCVLVEEYFLKLVSLASTTMKGSSAATFPDPHVVWNEPPRHEAFFGAINPIAQPPAFFGWGNNN